MFPLSGTFRIEKKLRKQERELRVTELKYQTILDSAADSVYLADTVGNILNVNRHACDELGYSHQELTSMRLHDIDVEIIEDRLGA